MCVSTELLMLISNIFIYAYMHIETGFLQREVWMKLFLIKCRQDPGQMMVLVQIIDYIGCR